MQYDQLLDTSGLLCPVPMLKTKKALKQLSPGKILKVVTTDLASEKDIKSLLALTGDELLVFEEDKDGFIFVIKKL